MVAKLVEADNKGTEPVEMGFQPTFTGSFHERDWILNYLGPFYHNHQITDVLRRVQGGKEANVYCCAAHPSTGLELVAAKVYRPRMFRNLRNDARYRAGRAVLDGDGIVVHDDRLLRAVRKKTAFGRELAHTSWLAHEFQTLQLLYEAGAAVPRPLEQSENTILMAYLGEELTPAPTLHQVRLAPDQVWPLFQRLMENVELMMAHNRVHGDLSAFNVLYWEGEFWIIDFPQAIDPWVNPDAAQILQRDITRLCDYFARYGIRSDPLALADDLWERYGPPRIEPVPAEEAYVMGKADPTAE
jgi:RIO kinase 1